MIYRELGNTGIQLPAIGQGTYRFGEDPARLKEEISALQLGVEKGLTLIDTAEFYGNGESERVIGQALADVRKDLFIVTKVWPNHCSYEGVLQAAEQSLDRLKTDYIDLYLQHWPSKMYPLEESMQALSELLDKGLVNYVGVSNFGPELLQKAQQLLGDRLLVVNQVGYHLKDRSIENDVLPYCREHNITVMGYSPYGQGDFPQPGTQGRKVLDEIGENHGKTAFQVALNWILRQEGLIPIPKAADPKHMISNIEALGWELTDEELQRIDHTFPRPTHGMRVQFVNDLPE